MTIRPDIPTETGDSIPPGGRAHAIKLLQRYIEHVSRHDDVWFATLSDIHDRWTD